MCDVPTDRMNKKFPFQLGTMRLRFFINGIESLGGKYIRFCIASFTGKRTTQSMFLLR